MNHDTNLMRMHLARLWYRNRLLGLVPEHYNAPTAVQLEITYRCNLRCRQGIRQGTYPIPMARCCSRDRWSWRILSCYIRRRATPQSVTRFCL